MNATRAALAMLSLASVPVFAASSLAAAPEPIPTSPEGAPAFRIDLAAAADEDAPLMPYAFASDGTGTVILLWEAWSEATESYLELHVYDPVRAKDLERFGPIRDSAAGGGEQSTPDDVRQAIQAALDQALARRRFRPAATSEGVEARVPFDVPVAKLRIGLEGRRVVAHFEVGGKPKTRKVAVKVPRVYKRACAGGATDVDIARVHYDDGVPWVIADVVIECTSRDLGDTTLAVPVVVDLR